MDLPVLLEKMTFVSAMDELKQTIVVLLKNPRFSFLQSPHIGSFVSIHATDQDEIETGIKNTLEEIPDLVVNLVELQDESNVLVNVTYRGNVQQFTFNIDEV